MSSIIITNVTTSKRIGFYVSYSKLNLMDIVRTENQVNTLGLTFSHMIILKKTESVFYF